MDHDCKPEPIWQRLDQPMPMSPSQQQGIRSRVLASISVPDAFGPEPLRALDEPTSIRWRSRLLDLAAVAVILLGMIGVLSRSSQPANPVAVQTVQAPVTANPEVVMLGGSPAQDYQYPGSIPGNLPYEIAAEIAPGMYQSLDQTLIYESTLFVLHEAGSNVELIAYALSDARELWRTSVADPLIAVTDNGVLTSRSVPGDPEFEIVLLDHETGTQVWASEQTFPASSMQTSSRLLVEDESIYFADAGYGVTALNRRTGTTEWTVEQIAMAPPGLSDKICPSANNCYDRSSFASMIAANDGKVYFVSSVLGKIIAIDRENGSMRWSIEMNSIAPSHDISYQIAAIPGGVVVELYRYRTNTMSGSMVLARLSEMDGSIDWTISEDINTWVTNGETILAKRVDQVPLGVNTDDPACCYVLRIDVDTGEIEQQIVSPDIFILGLVDDGQTAVTIEMDRLLDGEFRGYNVYDWSPLWDIDLPERGCWPQLPSSDDGVIACSGLNGGIKILQPAP